MTGPTRGDATPNDQQYHTVERDQLPLHCPLPEMSLWDSHPRVYLPIEETGHAKCPYCGTEFTLTD
ncbi:MAG: zinc-finger domain-containing protein [Gammaproteobacteria bacterium]